MDQLRPTHLVIHLDRLVENYKELKKLSKPSGFLCPMVKANAYGHGDVAVSQTLVEKLNCQFLGVSSVEEAIGLYISGVKAHLLVFNFTGKEAVEEILKNNFVAIVSNFDQLGELVKQAKTDTKIHLKFNTGMNRLGFQLSELEALKKSLAKNSHLKVQGLCTHLASGDNIHLTGSSTDQQLINFKKAYQQFQNSSVFLHAYNSAATARLHLEGLNLEYGLRPGLLSYGIDPEEDLPMKPLVSPVMEYKSKIVATQEVKSGEVVSYGGTWKASKDSLIGIVPAGYADGVCRSLSNEGEFLVREKRVPIRGRVCMDYTMVDLSGLTPKKDLIGEEVVLIGKQGQEEILVEEFSRKAGRITYEVVTGISERVPRHYGE